MIGKDIIEQLAAEELVDANIKHEPKFNSPHEAYAVILEEFEEMKYEMKVCESYLGSIWDDIKTDDNASTKSFLEYLKKRAVMAVQEGIQVIAMCDKALKLYD